MEEVKPLSGLEDVGTTGSGSVYQRTFQPGEGEDINTVTLLRIYDMMGAILTQLDAILAKLSDEPEDLADDVIEAHANGQLIGPFPSLDI